MSAYQLAQLNIATLLAPLDSPQLTEFVDSLAHINALAEASPGFVWRLAGESGDATAFRPFGDNVVINLSVWRDLDALRDFAFRGEHAAILRRRSEWFDRMEQAYSVIWWVRAGHRPELDEAAERLALLRRDGPSAAAFGFRSAFPPPAGESS